MDINKEELDKILMAVTEEYIALEKAEAESADIMKADDDKKAPDAEDSQPPEKKKSPDIGSSEKEAAASEAPPPEGTMADAVDAGSKGDGEGPEDGEAAVEEGAGEVEEADAGADPDALCEMYMQLPPEHLAAHWMACSKAMFHQLHEGEMPEDEVHQVAQAEYGQEPSEEMPMQRSVEDFEEYKELIRKNQELEEHLQSVEQQAEQASESLAKYLGQPVSRGFTASNIIAKTDEAVTKPLSKSDIKTLLANRAKEPLNEDEKRKLINYTVNPVLTPDLKTFLGLK
jgi:hypothetical protein